MKPTETCRLVLLDGEIVAASDARISPLSDGFMFGHGLFETIKVLQGRAVFFDQHATRLELSAADLGLSVNHGWRERAEQLIAANALVNGVLKVVIFQGEHGASELVLARTTVYPGTKYETGFSLKTFADSRSGEGLGRWKTLNYLKNSRARLAARAEGFDEALFVDPVNGVLEGAATNIFLVKDGRVHTPSVSGGILPGIARGVVVKLGEANSVGESMVSVTALRDAEEVFVTNALLGVMPVSRVDDQVFPFAGEKSVTWKIMAEYCAAELRSIAR